MGFIARSFTKLVQQHSYETIAVKWNEKGIEKTIGGWIIVPLKIISQGYWLMMLFISFAGLYLLGKSNGFKMLVFNPIVSPWLYFSLVHAVIVSQDRYHFPAIPFISMLSAYALIELVNRFRDSQMMVSRNP